MYTQIIFYLIVNDYIVHTFRKETLRFYIVYTQYYIVF